MKDWSVLDKKKAEVRTWAMGVCDFRTPTSREGGVTKHLRVELEHLPTGKRVEARLECIANSEKRGLDYEIWSFQGYVEEWKEYGCFDLFLRDYYVAIHEGYVMGVKK